MTLYEMTEVATQLYDLFTNGEIPEEAVIDTLEGIGVEGKIEDYCYVINQLVADTAMIDTEIERLKMKKAQAKGGIERMKKALLAYMTAADIKKTNAGTFTLSLRKSKSVVVSDISKIPEKYIKVKTTTEPDKTALKKAIEAGENIEGATVQTNNNLQIK